MTRVTPEKITNLKENEVFVFGSNLKGVHGAGAAKTALSFGAKYGIGIGFSGNTYAIPTKNEEIKTMDLKAIKYFVDQFLHQVKNNPEKTFLLTPIGCGLAGYTAKEIAPMFYSAIFMENIYLPESFWSIFISEIQ
jgi:hypothetical protein